MTWEQLWYTACGLLALAGARLLDKWLPPHGQATVVVMPEEDDDEPGRHHRRRDG